MRTAFARTLVDLAKGDPRVWLLTGDLGFSVLEPFAAAFPDRYVNVGVAEQNMAGLAAGIAHSGNVVFVYSIANFPTFRCLEQIRNDICYPGLDVRIVSVGGGLGYGPAGYTHHGVEDVAVLRALPGMTVLSPGDPVEAELATRALGAHVGPAYLRLGKAGEPRVHEGRPDFRIGRALVVRPGNGLTLVATGSALKATLDAAEELRNEQGLDARVISMHTIKPLDVDTLLIAARETGTIVTVEEHSEIGGLGSAVADALSGRTDVRVRLARIALPDRHIDEIGSQSYLLSRFGSVADRVRRAVS
jgi:transketolase